MSRVYGLCLIFQPCFVISVIPGAFQTTVHGVISAEDYYSGVQQTLRAGGCNASRGGFIGACLAAQVSRNNPRWRLKLSALEAITLRVEGLLEHVWQPR